MRRFPWLCLDFRLDIGIACIHTALYRDAINSDCREYVMVYVEVWRKEILRFHLYETAMSRFQRLGRRT